MKRIFLLIAIVFHLLAIGHHTSMGQTGDTTYYNEKVVLFTDRTLYVVGEPLFFSATIVSTQSNSPLSKVLYLELITPMGESVSGGKYLIENAIAEGSLYIPRGTISGTYYIKAYTKYLRNFGANYYCYNAIKIINPLSRDVLATSSKMELNSNNNFADSSIIEKFTLTTDKGKCSTRESVAIHIENITNTKKPPRSLCLTVIPKASLYEQNYQMESKQQLPKLSYYSETKGISLTGRLVDNKTGRSITNKKVNLSIIDTKDQLAVRTDSAGRFFFLLPDYSGIKDVFISSENIEGVSSTILIDNDFCKDKINLPSPVFQLSEDEKRITYSFATNVQASSHFPSLFGSPSDSIKRYNSSFYGESSYVLILDKYIQLPSIEEYINELLYWVRIEKQKGKKYLKVIGNQPEMIIYEPLVLIDMVAIDDLDKFFEISPQKIERIEVINVPYVKGNITYGGIISLFSKQNDFAGIDLPTSGIFIDYSFWSKNDFLLKDPTILKNQPDTRNTLLWEPKISQSIDGKIDLIVMTSDSTGEYMVVLRGVNYDGKPFQYRTSFFVFK